MKNNAALNIRKTLAYKGYIGEFGIDDAGDLFGIVMDLKQNTLTFEGKTSELLERDFRDMLDEYLTDCAKDGVLPERPYKGSFNIRIGSERHALLARVAEERHTTINQLIVGAVDRVYSEVPWAEPTMRSASSLELAEGQS